MVFCVYILASQRNGTLYTGYTDDLASRVWQHREKVRPDSFTARHDVLKLVWYEAFEERGGAWSRERRIKKWRRAWKIELIERQNPGWHDLYEEIAAFS